MANAPALTNAALRSVERRVISSPYSYALFPHYTFSEVLKNQIQSEFSKYIEQLRRIVRHTCPSCHKAYCIACGEPVNAEKPHRPNAAAGDDPLFHCSNLQGVILGNGLSMLEQVYADVIQEPSEDQEARSRTNKRRKMDVPVATNHSTTPEGDDDDDVYYGPVGIGKGKKAKGGTGYAGDIKEDVSAGPYHNVTISPVLDFWPNRSLGHSTSER